MLSRFFGSDGRIQDMRDPMLAHRYSFVNLEFQIMWVENDVFRLVSFNLVSFSFNVGLTENIVSFNLGRKCRCFRVGVIMFSGRYTREFLARLHPYRDEPNTEYASYMVSLNQGRIISEGEKEPCSILADKVGRGDVTPLLDNPELSEKEVIL